jgi:peptide/nickel transport system permease protein
MNRNKKRNNLLKGLLIFMLLALLGDMIANDKPLYCSINGEVSFPVFQSLFGKNTNLTENWLERKDYQSVIFPPIPYSANYLDLKNGNFTSPFAVQNVPSWRFRHWFGTDLLGHDVLAGIVNGCQVAFLIGIGATAIALCLGFILGSLAGYCGNDRVRLSYGGLLLWLMGSFYSLFLALQMNLFEGVLAAMIGVASSFFLIYMIEKKLFASFFEKKIASVAVPFDTLIMQLITIKRSIPNLFLILVLVAILSKCTIFQLSCILGGLSWMTVALFVRGELLRIKEQDFMSAATSLGLSEVRIFFYHALPNIINPILILAATLITSSILAESSLSFLGIGLPLEEVTWGSLLRQAQNNFSAWWLALFPGLSIFAVVILFNRWAEFLRKR